MTSREAVTVTVTVESGAERAQAAKEPIDVRAVARLVEGTLRPSESGHLAYVGTDGNVYVVDPLTGATVQVTDDGSSAGTRYGIFHAGMAWSRSGELAFARTDVEDFASTLFVTVPGSGKVQRASRNAGILIYASWSPAACRASRCGELATITDVDREPGGRVALNVLAFPGGSSARSVLEEKGAQIYFAWAAPRDRLIRHVVGDDIIHGAHRLDDLDLRSHTSRKLGTRLGPFLAPAFASGRVVYAVADSPTNESRVTVTKHAVVIHAPRDARRVAFAPSPDGKRLAFTVRLNSDFRPAAAFEEPKIADLGTGEVETVGSTALWTEAFYWSPDSRKLAYLSWLDNEYRPYNQWRIFDAVTGTDKGSAFFQPTDTFDTLTTFFDQFGQSHSFWSPDSRYVAYGAVSDAGEEQVWLLDTEDGGSRMLVADGVVGVFSRR